jgi:hypothetical protein
MFNQFAKYEDAFAAWRRDGLPGIKPESYKYIDFLSDPTDERQPREGTLWPHQWEAFLRVVYAHEIIGKHDIGGNGLLLNIVTGGGKTAIIAAVAAWLRIAHGTEKFVLICPNLIVRDRLSPTSQRKVLTRPAAGIVQPASQRLPADHAGRRGRQWLGEPLLCQHHAGKYPPVLPNQQGGKSNLSGLMGAEFARSRWGATRLPSSMRRRWRPAREVRAAVA